MRTPFPNRLMNESGQRGVEDTRERREAPPNDDSIDESPIEEITDTIASDPTF